MMIYLFMTYISTFICMFVNVFKYHHQSISVYSIGFVKFNKSKTAIVIFYLIPTIENKIFFHKQVSANESVESNIIFCTIRQYRQR